MEHNTEVNPEEVEIITINEWTEQTYGKLAEDESYKEDYQERHWTMLKYCAANNVHYYCAEKENFMPWFAQMEAADLGKRKVIVENLS